MTTEDLAALAHARTQINIDACQTIIGAVQIALAERVNELIRANTAEVERRRKAEAEAAAMLIISRTMAARVAELERELETQRAIEEAADLVVCVGDQPHTAFEVEP